MRATVNKRDCLGEPLSLMSGQQRKHGVEIGLILVPQPTSLIKQLNFRSEDAKRTELGCAQTRQVA